MCIESSVIDIMWIDRVYFVGWLGVFWRMLEGDVIKIDGVIFFRICDIRKGREEKESMGCFGRVGSFGIYDIMRNIVR